MNSVAHRAGTRRLPPFGNAIRAIVLAGRRPLEFGGAIAVCLDWKIGSCWPRIVLPPDQDPTTFDLSFLAGLHVLVFWRPGHSPDHIAAALEAVRAARPAKCAPVELPHIVRDE
jgi:hypothetical protein